MYTGFQEKWENTESGHLIQNSSKLSYIYIENKQITTEENVMKLIFYVYLIPSYVIKIIYVG